MAVAFLAGVLATTALRPAPVAEARSTDGTWEKLDVFAKVLSYVRNNYVEELDESALVYGAIRGMLGTLDPHTVFMDPREYRSLKDDTAGEFGGLGIELAIRGRDLVVLAPIDDTPASRAGIRAGDLITAIEGRRTRGLPLSGAIELLKGPPGSTVSLELFRDGFTAARRFTLVRDRIRVPAVESRLIDGRYGYVRIKSFQDRTDRHLERALTQLRAEAGPRFAGLVLDLRNNPGGLLDQGVKVADRFLKSGTIVTTRGRGGKHTEAELATERGTEPDYPLVVLINTGTASASEIVAGALKDHGRAVLVGEQSFGKGSVQTVIELDDGSGLKLTIARYYTPSGRSIHQTGIEPDIPISAAPRPENDSRRLPPDVSPYELPVVEATNMDGPLPQTAGGKTRTGAGVAAAVGAVIENALNEGTPHEKSTAKEQPRSDPDAQLDVALSVLNDWKNRPRGSSQ